MYQLFIFFMVTDPKTTVRPMWAQCLVVFIVAFVEMMLRLNEVVYAPFYALFLVGPVGAARRDVARRPPCEDCRVGRMKPVEEYAGKGQLTWLGESQPVGYRLTRLQGMAANGLPVPGLFRIEGDLDLRGARRARLRRRRAGDAQARRRPLDVDHADDARRPRALRRPRPVALSLLLRRV